MSKLLASILTAASAALVLPLSVYPDAVSKCADPAWHFLTTGQNGKTVQDLSDHAKVKFCGVVHDSITL